MAQFTRKNTLLPEQLWNVSLLPMAAPHRAVEPPLGPSPLDGGSALRSAAVLSLTESEEPALTARAA